MRTADPITYLLDDTALGVALIAASPRGVCTLEFGDDATDLVTALEARYPGARALPAGIEPVEPLVRWLTDVRHALRAPSDGIPGILRRPPAVPLDLSGTRFQLAIWRQLQTVPRGEVVSYRDLAQAIGASRSVRAVGSACGANRLALLVPCHRAVRLDGGLGGYRWGLDRKVRLLAWERTAR